jgi:hypothetical protein
MKMSRGNQIIAGVLAVIVGVAFTGVWWLDFLLVPGLCGGYRWEINRNGWVDCPRCAGSNRSSSRNSRAFRVGCGSRRCYLGRRVRWGVRILQPSRASQMMGGGTEN